MYTKQVKALADIGIRTKCGTYNLIKGFCIEMSFPNEANYKQWLKSGNFKEATDVDVLVEQELMLKGMQDAGADNIAPEDAVTIIPPVGESEKEPVVSKEESEPTVDPEPETPVEEEKELDVPISTDEKETIEVKSTVDMTQAIDAGDFFNNKKKNKSNKKKK